MDSQINKSIQKREMEKIRGSFYKNLQQHYSQRKYKELITLGCADKCLTKESYHVDDLTRVETDCFKNCFHKYYRYLTYSNALYTYLTTKEADEHTGPSEKEEQQMDSNQMFQQMTQQDQVSLSKQM
jgi:hypothetical protein